MGTGMGASNRPKRAYDSILDRVERCQGLLEVGKFVLGGGMSNGDIGGAVFPHEMAKFLYPLSSVADEADWHRVTILKGDDGDRM